MRGRWVLKLWFAAGVATLSVGAWLTVDQHASLRGATGVPGRVLSTGVAATVWGTHRPAVEVEYEVAGRSYRTRRWSWLGLGGTAGWAARSAAELSSGDEPGRVTVWVDAERADRAWVDESASVVPVVAWLGGLGVMGGWLGAWRRARSLSAAAVATPTGHRSWYGLRGQLDGRDCVGTAWGRVALVGLGGVPAVVHHGAWAGGHWLGTLAASAVVVGLCGWWLARAVRLSVWSGRLVPPRVSTTRAVMCLEHDLVARVKLSVRRPVVLRTVRTSLVCRRYDGLSSTELYRSTYEDVGQAFAKPASPIVATHGFSVPPRKRRATLDGRGGDERIAWTLEVVVEPEYGPAMTTIYPIDAAHEQAVSAAKPRLTGASRTAAA